MTDFVRTPSGLLLPTRRNIRTYQRWTEWRLARHLMVAPAPLSRTQRTAGGTGKLLHDMERHIWHSNLPKTQTPMAQAIVDKLNILLQVNTFNADPGVRAAAFLSGDGGEGKTALAMEFAAQAEELVRVLYGIEVPTKPGTRDQYIPVCYSPIPADCTIISLCKRLLKFYGETWGSRDNRDALVTRLLEVMDDCGTILIVLDDITRLRMHREADQQVSDFIRDLMEIGATFLLLGIDIHSSGLLWEGSEWQIRSRRVKEHKQATSNARQLTQTERRYTLHELTSYAAPDDQWIEHLRAIEQNLLLYKAPDNMLSDPTMAEYLFHTTRGVVGRLSYLIKHGCIQAITDGSERLTEAGFNAIDLDFDAEYGNADAYDDEDPAAKLQRKSAAPKPRRRRKNGVFTGRRRDDVSDVA